MYEERLPKSNLILIASGRKKRDRPKTRWKEGALTKSYGRTWSIRWRLGGQTSLEMGV
jgi:hypothetical protein